MSFEHLKSIYRNFDIRGEYPNELHEDEVQKIARALVVLYKAKTVVIGHDYRPSSETLFKALIDGITLQGSDVVSVGMVTTPMLYHAAGINEADVGIMITGSHMPPNFNGMKICIANVVPIGLDSGLAEVRDFVLKNEFPAVDTLGTVSELEIHPIWLKHCHSLINFVGETKTKVVIDPANMVGIMDVATVEQFKELEVTTIFDNYDWNCPNHEANPMKLDTLKDLGDSVVKQGASIGIALDGDADRIGIVDETGTPIPQDVIGALVAKELLQRNNNEGTVLFDVRSSKHVAEVISEYGGTPVPWRIGHTYLRRKMHELDALYAIELSGHHFFKDTHNSEGGIFPALLIIEIMRKENKKLSELASEHTIYFHSAEINSEVNLPPEEIFEHLKLEFIDADYETIDGLTIKYDTWWCNVRPSANDPVMRLNLEADTKELMEEKRDAVLAVIQSN